MTDKEKKEYYKLRYELKKEIIKAKQKEYRLKNADKIKIKQKEYRENNKLVKQKLDSEYRENNKEYFQNYQKQYSLENSDKLKKLKKEYHDSHKNERKEYLLANKDKVSKTRIEYVKHRLLTDPMYKLKHSIRNSINDSIRKSGFKKLTRTEQILGCTYNEFKTHLESKFESWMTWENKGNPKNGILEPNKTWDIDHIIPTSSAKCELDIIKLNHYTNLQPLCSYTNRLIKRDIH